MSKPGNNDSLDGITESDIEDAAPEILIIDASDMEAINIEWTNDFQNSLTLTEHSPYICYCYSFWTITESFVLHIWLFLKKNNKCPVTTKHPPLSYLR